MAAIVPGRTVTRETLGAKLRRLAGQHRFDNPFVNGPMASPPSVTATATPAAGATAYRLDSPSGAALRTFGGTRVFTPTSAYARFPVATVFPGGTGNVNGNGQPGNQSATSFQMELMADASAVSLALLNSPVPYRFLVEGPETGFRLQQVSSAGTVVNVGGGTGYANLAFASRTLRRIVVEGEQGQGFLGASVGASETIHPTAGSDLLRGLFLSDSFAEGAGAARVNDNVGNVMMAALGIRDRRCSGLGATGWKGSLGGTRYTIGERIAIDLVPQAPDVAFVAAGINDVGQSTAAITAEVTLRLRELRAARPALPVFVLGPWPARTGPSSALLAVEAAISAGVAAASDPLAIFIPVVSDPAGPWMSGTGKTDAPTGTGNADLYVSPDGTHPPSAGHVYLGLRAADAVMGKLGGLG